MFFDNNERLVQASTEKFFESRALILMRNEAVGVELEFYKCVYTKKSLILAQDER